jgi:hypothetical protein
LVAELGDDDVAGCACSARYGAGGTRGRADATTGGATGCRFARRLAVGSAAAAADKTASTAALCGDLADAAVYVAATTEAWRACTRHVTRAGYTAEAPRRG